MNAAHQSSCADQDAAAPDVADAAPMRWIGFELAGQRYAVDLGQVREIVRPPEITPVPGAAGDVLGVISLRGGILGVLDGCRRLGLATECPATADVRLVVFALEGGPVALRVDAIGDVIEAPRAALQAPPAGRSVRADDPVSAVLTDARGFVAVLDAARLCHLQH